MILCPQRIRRKGLRVTGWLPGLESNQRPDD
jgi:hypothetical protein